MACMVLSGKYSILASSSDPENLYTGSPSLAGFPNGRLVASYEWFRPKPLKEEILNQTEILVSDDGAVTWRKVAAVDFIWASLFIVGDVLYIIGNRRKSRDICIARSSDGGESWTDIVTLFQGRFHGAPTHVLLRSGIVYRAFETCLGVRSEWKSLVVAGDLSRDLLAPSSWRMSNKLGFPKVPGVLTQGKYPANNEDKVPHDSWLEGNVIEVDGEFRVVLRTIIDGHSTAGLAAVCGFKDDGFELKYRFLQFYPMPGAQCKFHIVKDPIVGLFWTTVVIPTDTWQDREPLREIGFQGPPGNERRILMLMYSKDALNWLQAGCVAIDEHPCNSFSYASQLIFEDDLLILARTSQGGRNQHDTNLITLHRVRKFREFALDLSPRLDNQSRGLV